MYESSKSRARRQRDPLFAARYFVGRGIDIGAGPDSLAHQMRHWPKLQDVYSWDRESGDAQRLAGVPDGFYDFAYSSHTLEHMRAPISALFHWHRVVKPGGYLIVVVPDEDLYEGGIWPPHNNRDHKATFTIAKAVSWSPVSYNVADLLKALPGDVLKIERLEAGYDVTLDPAIDQTDRGAECGIEFILRTR